MTNVTFFAIAAKTAALLPPDITHSFPDPISWQRSSKRSSAGRSSTVNALMSGELK
jgi:hypothetical protein